MDIGNVLTDAIKYPLSGWDRFFILGIIFVISGIGSYFEFIFGSTYPLTTIFLFIGFIIGLFAYGYLLRI